MIDISNFFKVQFYTYKISDDKLNMFAQDHVQRLTANNPEGKYNGILSEVTSALEAYTSAIQNESIGQAQQEAGTVETIQYMREFIEMVSNKEGIIRGTWGKDHPVYQEFYPYGSQEYHNSNKANIEDLMNRFCLAAESHITELPAGFVQQFNTIKTLYINSRREQLKLIGKTDGNKMTTSAKRRDLEKQLMRNLLFIAFENVGNAGAAKVYFDQSIIRLHISKPVNKPLETQPIGHIDEEKEIVE